MKINRRTFFKIITAFSFLASVPKYVNSFQSKYATLVYIPNCDGCENEPLPRCVKACRDLNRYRFPEPKKPIQPYWPRPNYEDWSNERDRIDTLTPYNWLFVQKIQIENNTINIPRRCMHCDYPPCVKGCPFGALSKEPEGNTVIDDKICFGGAKCRDICPWHIPQRQAGVGFYLKLLPKFAGGGVMYKCDLCNDRIKKGVEPACVIACRDRLKDKSVYKFGRREDIYAEAKRRTENEGVYIYGMDQNGGTGTIYLSTVPFEKIEAKLKDIKARFQMPVKVRNRYSDITKPLGIALVTATLFGAVTGTLAAILTKKGAERGL
ncbi:MAG: 4Fe-4S dicluster domain-containing protein [Deltaproteobacteria bacterium]|nr:4Fe-4S dicluster domain-containing protein [Deltaproteobacteria bacterium]